MANNRISSLDSGYIIGDLSIYPSAYDDDDTLFYVRNNCETNLTQGLTFNGKKIIVEDTSSFPETGLIRVGPRNGPGPAEIIAYNSKTATTFTDLIRGFAGSQQNKWEINSWITGGVMAEHHNAVKDAIINIQRNLGLKENPDPASINGILKDLEIKYLAPKPAFRAFPRTGAPDLQVSFHNFSNGDAIRFLWDFGDGSTSIERNPIHTYLNEGVYTIKLNMLTSTGSQGIMVKNNYIKVSGEEKQPFFYVVQKNNTPSYSIQTAAQMSSVPAIFEFVDQTDGDIAQRFWVFDDGTTEVISDSNIHTVEHSYELPGEYSPFLLVMFSNQRLKRVLLTDKVTVL